MDETLIVNPEDSFEPTESVNLKDEIMNDGVAYSTNNDSVLSNKKTDDNHSAKTLKSKKKNLLKEISTPLGKVRILFENVIIEAKSNETTEVQSNSHIKYTPVLTSDGKIALLYKGDVNINSKKKYEPIIVSFNEANKSSFNNTLRLEVKPTKPSIKVIPTNDLLQNKKHLENKTRKHTLKKQINVMKDDLLIYKINSRSTVKPKKNNEVDNINLAIVPIFDVELERNILNKKSKTHHIHNHYLRANSNIHTFLQTLITLSALITCISICTCYIRKRIIRNLRLLYW